MAIVIARTLIVYFALLLTMRLMGKRQLGEMELSEFVVAALIADLAAHPLQDMGIPLLNGLVPIAVLFEYVFGIRADSAAGKIVWRVNRTERHGVERYPFGGQEVTLVCEARRENERPHVTVTSREPVAVEVVWNGETFPPAEQRFDNP